MANATVTWGKTTTGTPTKYVVVWGYNGSNQSPVDVPVDPVRDASQYSADFNSDVPGVTLNNGDTVSVTVQAVDTANNLSGPATPATPATATVGGGGLVAPGAPQNVVLTLS